MGRAHTADRPDPAPEGFASAVLVLRPRLSSDVVGVHLRNYLVVQLAQWLELCWQRQRHRGADLAACESGGQFTAVLLPYPQLLLLG